MVKLAEEYSLDLQKFLADATKVVANLDERSPKELVASTMLAEMVRLENFVNSALDVADGMLKTGLIPDLVCDASYFEPPLARPVIRFRPRDDFYKHYSPYMLLGRPIFQQDQFVPRDDQTAGIEINAEFISPFMPQVKPALSLDLSVNYESTMRAFDWIFREWRRPLTQLLRSLPEITLWGNGNTLKSDYNIRAKDPAILMQLHFDAKKSSDDNKIDLRSTFDASNSFQDVVLTLAVYLAIFDSIYRLMVGRAEPDRLLKHYQSLQGHLPRVPFRITSVFPKEEAENSKSYKEYN